MIKNLLVKILVLLIAILLWMQFTLIKIHEEKIPISIKLVNVPHDLVLEDKLSEIPVHIRAKGMDILFLKLSKANFEIDARNFKYGKNKLKFTEKNLVYAHRITLQILNIDNPGNLHVNMDKLVEKKKSIEILYASAKDEEFFIENKITNTQQKVTVKGPLSILNEIKIVQTEPISKKMVKNGKLTVLLIKPDVKAELLKDRIIFDVTQTKSINRTISLIPIKFPETENISIIPQKVSVMVRGPKEIVEKLDSNSIIAELNLAKIRKGFTEVKFEVPAGIRIIEYTPKRIQIIEN